MLLPNTSNNEAPHEANDDPVRFFFFLPPPAGPFITVESCEVEGIEGAIGVVPRATGAGVTEFRWLVPAATDSGALLSLSDAMLRCEVNVRVECKAVVLIALNMSAWACCFLGALDPAGLCLSSWDAVESPSPELESISSPAGFLLVASDVEVSTIGHMNPVRGV